MSFLPICNKDIERLVYDTAFSFLLKNNLIPGNEFSFKLGNSCVNQLLAVTHKIWSSFENIYEAVFIDIYKTFGKVSIKELSKI